MHAPQLGGAKTGAPPNPTAGRQQLIDKLIRDMPGEQFQKPCGSDRWQIFAHAQRATRLDATCRDQTQNSQIFSVSRSLTDTYASFRNTLLWDRDSRQKDCYPGRGDRFV